MRHRSDVRTVGDLLDVIDGLDPNTPLVWEHDSHIDLNDEIDAAVEVRPSAVFITLLATARPNCDDCVWGSGDDARLRVLDLSGLR